MWSFVRLKDYVMHMFFSGCGQPLGKKEGRIDQVGTDSVLVASLQP